MSKINSDLKYLERFSGVIFGIILAVLVHYLNLNLLGSNLKFVEVMIGLSGTIFGFLFASLAILIQGTSPKLIDLISKRPIVFDRIVRYNRSVVFISLVVAITSIIFLLIEDLVLNNHCINIFYAFIIGTLFGYTFLFLHIFYLAILSKK